MSLPVQLLQANTNRTYVLLLPIGRFPLGDN